jgi:hypothetical protein
MQMTTIRTWALAVTGALIAAPTMAVSQQIDLRIGPGVVVGVVTDTAGRPIDAELFLSGRQSRAVAGLDGRFRFVGVSPGRLEIAARRVGYYPRTMRTSVPDSGIFVTIKLVPLPNRLPPVITAAARGGLSGVVGDTSFQRLGNAQIEVVAGGRAVKTDSAGEFYVPLKPGKHMVRVSRLGYATRLVSVTVPRDSGRRMQVWLSPSDEGFANKEAFAIQSMERRVIRRNPVYSTLLSREDMEKLGPKPLHAVASNAAVQRVNEDCPVSLPAYTDPFSDMPSSSDPGAASSIPLWALDAEDVEFMEIYANTKPARVAQRSMRAGPVVQKSAPAGCPTIIVWLRK